MDEHCTGPKPVTREAEGELALDASARRDPLSAPNLLAS
jgi:hypothetical protein